MFVCPEAKWFFLSSGSLVNDMRRDLPAAPPLLQFILSVSTDMSKERCVARARNLSPFLVVGPLKYNQVTEEPFSSFLPSLQFSRSK